MKTHPPSLARLALPLVAVCLGGCGKSSPVETSQDTTAARAIAVRASAAVPRAFERRLSVQGSLEAKRFAHVAARVEGNLDALWVDEGDVVVAGETRLFQIDPVGLSNSVFIAEQALAVAKAGQAVAEASAGKTRAEARKTALDHDRYVRLHKEGKVSDNEYETQEVLNEQAKAGIAVAVANVDLAARQAQQAEAALAIARKKLDDSLVIAPISGLVSSRSAEPGEQMSVGHVVLRIDDLSVIEAAAFVPAQYYADVQPGATRFRLGLNGREAGVHGITYRSPTINPALRTFEIRGQVAVAAGAAVPGSMADLTLVFEARQGLAVPSSAVLVRGAKEVVFVVKDGAAASREVQTGLQNDGWTEVVAGITAEDQVVIEGQTQLRDGSPVEVR